MKPKSRIPAENMLQNIYQQVTWMPPLWQVIYQEAMRANHLLFTPTDVEAFSAPAAATLNAENDADHLSDLTVQLLSCSDLSSMRHLIAKLPTHTRRHMFSIYTRMLSSWRHRVANNLN